MIGSSLGGYLSLVADPHRAMRTSRCANIFHPLDPLAQRLEPWIAPDVWAENLAAAPFDVLEFPLHTVPPPVSTSVFLERNAGHSPQRLAPASAKHAPILLLHHLQEVIYN